jgi:Na+/H+ antiporter NhaD/arsenite permease-like protein
MENPTLLAAAIVEPHLLMIAPFALMLLAIAIVPFVSRDWWHHHYPNVAVALALVTASYYTFMLGQPARLLHVTHEYVSFVALIGSLYVISGGIHIRVKGEATPQVNCLFLFAGAVLANLIGTSGASMVLIRPWIRINKYRITGFHVVFFIFLVSNIGGCLTPIGDPPLFLGYLKGVPFWWVSKQCWQPWLLAVAALLAVFYVFDRRNFLRAPRRVRERETREENWKCEGLHNLFFLGVVLGAVFVRKPVGLSEALMAGAALVSYLTTPKPLHEANDFSFEPVREVAWLFGGIFVTMMPALDYLEVNAQRLPLDSSAGLFWLTGLLSATLDNAPTYLTALAAALGKHGLSITQHDQVAQFAATNGIEFTAISLGAVFFGAMTYIGNGPNFMVRSITENAKIETPHFFEYMWRFSLPILLPLFVVISLLFFVR